MAKGQHKIRALKQKAAKSVKAKAETNSTAHKKLMAQDGQWNCIICPPWEDENRVRKKPKRTKAKPKYKNKRM